mmetsp:Transcript_38219/g.88933  ORF Transcript_38219/g.88933 Transcript_38219/m.88933 type:complete len:95 (-) Transcript_38219:200-484(-)
MQLSAEPKKGHEKQIPRGQRAREEKKRTLHGKKPQGGGKNPTRVKVRKESRSCTAKAHEEEAKIPRGREPARKSSTPSAKAGKTDPVRLKSPRG